MSRQGWDHYFMDIARKVATRATCLRRRVGSVAVKNRRILATGYNGAPMGLDHCLDVGCLRDTLGVPSGERHELCRAVHSEANVVAQAAMHGIPLAGADLYVTCHPCSLCAKTIVQVGFTRVIYEGEYNDPLAKEIFTQAGLTVVQLGAARPGGVS